jgi:hypothetical protein
MKETRELQEILEIHIYFVIMEMQLVLCKYTNI